MKLLLDTHLLLWASGHPEKLSEYARDLLLDDRNHLYFSAASIWEIVIKKGMDRVDFRIDPYRLRRLLISNGYLELPITSDHCLEVDRLPPIHKDPFDRILISQSRAEGLLLLTVDDQVAAYIEGIRKV